jgi:hypothetical protein
MLFIPYIVPQMAHRWMGIIAPIPVLVMFYVKTKRKSEAEAEESRPPSRRTLDSAGLCPLYNTPFFSTQK